MNSFSNVGNTLVFPFILLPFLQRDQQNLNKVLEMGAKVGRFVDTIKYFGGPRGYIVQRLRTDDAKMGVLVGVDKFGNKYYENNYFFVGRNRWVQYSDQFGYDYDGSQVPSEWYGWLHYKTDLLPHEDPGRPKYKWMIDGNENMTGTTQQYVPYSTTKPKVEPWKPKRNTSTM